MCEAQFSYQLESRNPVQMHSREKKPLQCEICHFRFSYPSGLKRHMQKHSGEKPFECEVCGSKFSLSSILKVHMQKTYWRKTISM